MSAVVPTDASFFPNEPPDIEAEAVEVFGAAWLDLPNARLGGQNPLRAIDDQDGWLVRSMLREVKHGCLS